MASSQRARQRIGHFYVDAVLPALVTGLDRAFPEFGWKPDARALRIAYPNTSPDRRRAATNRSRAVLTGVAADL